VREGLLLVQWDAGHGLWRCQVVALNGGDVLADIAIPDARQPQARLYEDCIVVHDRCGRCAVIETATARVRQMALG
jgi:hypothetical protein